MNEQQALLAQHQQGSTSTKSRFKIDKGTCVPLSTTPTHGDRGTRDSPRSDGLEGRLPAAHEHGLQLRLPQLQHAA